MRSQAKGVADTRSALTRKEVEGKKSVGARLVAKGYQNPDLQDSHIDIAGCASGKPSHLELIPLSASKRWRFRILDTKNASLQVGGFDHEGFLRAPGVWDSKDNRVWPY